jgi:hypothetical protein
VQKIIEFADNYNKNNAEGKILCCHDGEEIFVAGCTPLMKRVHEMFVEAGDVVMVDSTGNFESSGARVFFFVCPTAAGGFPLAFGIAPSESTDALEKLFRLVQKCIPATAFNGRGPESGPKIFLIDGSLSERHALERVWPQAVILLCTFHVLQSTWRWLCAKAHDIHQEDRQALFYGFRDILYGNSENDCFEKKEKLVSMEEFQRYRSLSKKKTPSRTTDSLNLKKSIWKFFATTLPDLGGTRLIRRLKNH